MNLVGKILVVLIAFMSLVFMSFTLAVHATHKNYKDEIERADTGLNARLKKAQDTSAALTADRDEKVKQLKREEESWQNKVAQLEGELKNKREDLAALKATEKKQADDSREAVAAMAATQANTKNYYEDLKAERQKILDAIQDRDKHFNELVATIDQLQQSTSDKEQLRLRAVELAKDVAKAENLLKNLGFDPKRDYSKTPPIIDGLVTATRGGGLVEISLGADQGLVVGHRLEVTRRNGSQGLYVGRIEVVRTEPDRAVCKIDPSTLKSAIAVNDRVETKIK